jgi:hypothetical protein
MREPRGSAAHSSPFLGHWTGPVPRFTPFSTVIGAAGSVVVLGEAGMGVWGKTWNGPWFCGAGGVPGFPPVRFRIGLPSSVYSCSRAVVFLTSTTLLCEGLRSGTRRRRGASASAQAGGETETETRRTAPAHAPTAVYGTCADAVRCVVQGISIRLRPPSQTV